MLLSVRNLTKTYPTEEGPLQVLSGVSFDVARGESLALTGESGSGKSTLLHILGGLAHADGGEVAVEGRDIAGFDDDARALYRRTGVGLVFQQFNLIPSLNVRNESFIAEHGLSLFPCPFARILLCVEHQPNRVQSRIHRI